MANPPALTPEQRAAALQKAAEARAARAELKEKLKMGSVTLSELLGQGRQRRRHRQDQGASPCSSPCPASAR